jgi:hypothetical protein
MSIPSERPERRYELDWLRVFAILLLHVFHSGMAYVKWDWHVKNGASSATLEELMYFLHQWRMPLLFLISGAGTRFALGFRTGGMYAAERVKRLLVPVIFGMLVIVPPQIYFERLQQGQPFHSFWQFYPHVFLHGPYPRGNLSWHHLWFVVYLLCYSLVALPLFLHWRGARGKRQTEWLSQLFARPGVLLLGGLPLALIQAALRPAWPATNDLLHDWANHGFYLTFFIYGFLICSDERFWRALEAQRKAALQLACLTMLLSLVIRWNGLEPRHGHTAAYRLYLALGGFNSWFWVLAVLGYGLRHLKFNNRLLQYANEGIYPFYILHQTLIVMVAFYVVQTRDEVWLKYVFTLGLSFLATLAIYEFLVRPFNVTRFLFGMKPLRPHAPAPTH